KRQAEERVAAATAEAKATLEEGERRRAAIEAEIGELEALRDRVLADLDRLGRGVEAAGGGRGGRRAPGPPGAPSPTDGGRRRAARRRAAGAAGGAARRRQPQSPSARSAENRRPARLRRVAEPLRLGQRLQLLQRVVLDLADPLARDVERLADLLQRARATAGE